MMKSPIVRVVSLNTMPRAAIWSRLGYREKTADKSAILPKYEPLLERWVQETKIRIFHLEKKIQMDKNLVHIEEYAFASQLIQTRFSEASGVFLISASAIAEDYQRLQQLQNDDIQQAVILDAVLSEKVDYGLDFLEQELAIELRRTQRKIGQRLSCGYGDFALDNQKYFHAALEFERYGISINAANILSPEKTVTALLPVYPMEK